MRIRSAVATAVAIVAASIGGAVLGGRLAAPVRCSCDAVHGSGNADPATRPSAAIEEEASRADSADDESPGEAPSARLDELAERLAGLERAIAAMDSKLSKAESPPPEPPLPETPADIREELSRLRSPITTRSDPDRARRLALIEHFLSTYPGHPDAAGLLATLVEDGIRTQDPTKAIADLDRFAESTGLSEWKRDLILADVHSSQHQSAPLREAYERIVASPDAPVAERARARFFYGYSFMSEGRYDDARAIFNDVIETFGGESDVRVQSTVQSARDHILKADEWEKR